MFCPSISLEGRTIDSDPLLDKVGILFSPQFSFCPKISLALGWSMVKVCVIHRADPIPPTSVIERKGIQLVLNSYFTYAGQRTRIHHQASPVTNALSHNDLFLRYSRDAVVVVGVTSPLFKIGCKANSKIWKLCLEKNQSDSEWVVLNRRI